MTRVPSELTNEGPAWIGSEAELEKAPLGGSANTSEPSRESALFMFAVDSAANQSVAQSTARSASRDSGARSRSADISSTLIALT